MFESEVLMYTLASVLLAFLNIYNTNCLIGLYMFKAKSKLGIYTKLSVTGIFNVYKQIIMHSKRVENASSTSGKAKACLKASRFWIWVSTTMSTALTLLMTVTLVFSITYGSLNDVMRGASTMVQLMDNKKCTCYARCTGDYADDDKTAYELLFGPDEYKKLVEAMNLEPQHKENLENMHNGLDIDGNSNILKIDASGTQYSPESGDAGDDLANRRRKEDGTLEPMGKGEAEFIIEHFKSESLFQTVATYRNIIDSSFVFRPGDSKDRKNMTDEQLETDLIGLLSDYKEFGRNPQCPVCGYQEDIAHSQLCLGGNHWVKGWTWDEIWRMPWDELPEQPQQPQPGTVIPPTGEWDNGAKNSIYGVELDDGWFYWYHQSSAGDGCINCGDWSDRLWGSSGASVWNKFGKDGCAVYSLAIGMSNLVGREITPTTLLIDLFDSSDNGNKRITNGKYFGGDNGRMIKYDPVINRLQQEYGLETSRITVSSGEQEVIAYIDDILARGGYVWGWWVDRKIREWCNGSSNHFMMIRKAEGDNYYCFTSCAGGSAHSAGIGGGKPGAIYTMNLPVSKHKVYEALEKSGTDRCVYGFINPNKKVGGGTGRYDDLNIQEINLNIPGTSGSFVWASDLHMICDADKISGLQQRKQIFTGDANFDYESILEQICNYADSQGMALVLGGDILDYASDANIEAYKRATANFAGPLYYIQSDHDKNKSSLAGMDISSLCTKSDSEISSLKGTFGNVTEMKIANSRIAMFNNTIVDGSKYSFSALGSTDVALFHTPFDYGDMRVADETRRHGHDKNYAWNSSGQYLLYSEGQKAADIRDKTRNCGGSVSGHVHPSSLVTIKDVYPNNGIEAITVPAYTKTIYKVNLGGTSSGGGNGGGNPGSGYVRNDNVYDILRQHSEYAGKEEVLAYAYNLGKDVLGSKEAAIGLMANILAEGRPGIVEGSFTKGGVYPSEVRTDLGIEDEWTPNQAILGTDRTFRLPSGGNTVKSDADLDYLIAWPSKGYKKNQPLLVGTNIKANSCGLGSIQWSFGRRIQIANIYKSYEPASERYTETALRLGDLSMIVTELSGDYYGTQVRKALKGTTAADWAEAIVRKYEACNNIETAVNTRRSTANALTSYLQGIE